MEDANLIVDEYSLHSIDVVKGAGPVNHTGSGPKSDLELFAKGILKELMTGARSRQFNFKSEDELVVSLQKEILAGASWSTNSEKIAEKLFSVESDVQDRIQHMNDVSKGGLLQIKINVESTIKFVIVKIDDGEFFDEIDLKFRHGLPIDKGRLQKAAVVSFGNDGHVESLILSDSKAKITEYWYKYFLVAEQTVDSETNTKNAFNSIEKLLKKEIQSVSSGEYWFIRNDVISYFRNQDSLAYEDLVERISEYKPENESLAEKFPSFIDKLKTLPSAKKIGFDTQFEIAIDVIKARINRKVMLDDNFELRIKGEIDDLKNKIQAEKDDKGKYIKIYSDVGYKEFSKVTK